MTVTADQHVFNADLNGDCQDCNLPEKHPNHYNPALPDLPYAGTSGHSGSDTSAERALREDADGTTSDRQAKVLADLAAAGPVGGTWKEVADTYGWHHGQASGALSVLHKTERIARLTERRDRCLVYVLPEYVNGRETTTQGRGPMTYAEWRQIGMDNGWLGGTDE